MSSSYAQPLAIRVKASTGVLRVWAVAVAVGALVVFPAITLLVLNRRDSREVRWIHELIVRKEALAAERQGTPRVLICGGSNALFGIDAHLIESKLGMPALNLATHAALGLSFLLDFMEREARRGDVVVLPLEWGQYQSMRGKWSETLAGYVWTYDRGYLLRAPRKEALRQFFCTPIAEYGDSISRLHGAMTGAHYEALYLRSGYDWLQLSPNGDLQAHAFKAVPVVARGLPPQKVDKATAARLRDAVDWARKNGVRLIFDWPNTVAHDKPPSDFDARLNAMRSFLRSLDAEVLDDPTDHFFPPEFFLDTLYHLNPTGRRIRTERLIARLRPLLQAPAPASKGASVFVIAGDRHEVNAGNLFADDAGMQFRKLAAAPGNHPDALTAEQISALHRGGMAVWCSDDETRARLADAGLELREVAKKAETLDDWLREYPDHLFLLASSNVIAGGAQGLPPEVAAAFQNAESSVAAFGTGRFRGLHALKREAGRVEFEKTVFEPLGKMALPIHLRLASGSEPPTERITLNCIELEAREPGLLVAVLDPVRQTLVRHGVFPPDGNRTAWRLWRAEAPAIPRP